MRIWTATILPCKSVRSEDMDYHNSSFQISAFRGYGLPQFFLATQSSPRIWITTILPCKSVQSKKISIFNSAHLECPIPFTYMDSIFILVCSVVSTIDRKRPFFPGNHRGIQGNFPLIDPLSTQSTWNSIKVIFL
jgi:hypothetical protein